MASQCKTSKAPAQKFQSWLASHPGWEAELNYAKPRGQSLPGMGKPPFQQENQPMAHAAPNKMDPNPLGPRTGATGAGMPPESDQQSHGRTTVTAMSTGNLAMPRQNMTSGIERSMADLADKMHPRG